MSEPGAPHLVARRGKVSFETRDHLPRDLDAVGRGRAVERVERERIARVLKFLRDDVNCQFKQLMDVCGVDYPGR